MGATAKKAAAAAKALASPLPKGMRVIEAPWLTGVQAVILGDCVFVPPLGKALARRRAQLVVARARRAGWRPAKVA